MKTQSTRIVTALVAGILAIVLAACGGGGSSDTGSSSSGGGGSSNGGGNTGGGGSPTVEKPAITTQPASQSVVAGSTATFSVVATGSATFTYQWKKNGADISGATSSTYATPATSDADIGAVLVYCVVVSNSADTVTSTDATLAVTPVPVAITKQPVAKTVTAGQTASFSVEATGTAPLGYQWKKDGTDITGANASTYTTDATVIGDDRAVFTVVVSNGAGSATSNPASLTVMEVPVITTQPTVEPITAGQTAMFSVTAKGTPPLIYQWKKGGTVIPGATSSSYTTPEMSIAGNGVEYSVVVSNNAGTASSSSATLKVNRSSATGYSLVANGNGGSYDKTECVKELSTGLVWEGKTASGTRAGTNAYTNYDASYTGGTDITLGTNSIGYVNSVNAGSGLCGFTDWRLPTMEELKGILTSSGSPRIDTTWFPNTQTFYWTSSPYVSDSSHAWGVAFDYGDDYYSLRSNRTDQVRLVR